MDKSKQNEVPCAMKDKEKNLKTKRNEIKEVYAAFYGDLFTKEKSNNLNSEIRNIKFESIKVLAKNCKDISPKINNNEIVDCIKKIKKHK